MFFPHDRGVAAEHNPHTRTAMLVCSGCVVRDAFAAYGANESFGIWAGVSHDRRPADTRSRARRRGKTAAAAKVVDVLGTTTTVVVEAQARELAPLLDDPEVRAAIADGTIWGWLADLVEAT